MNKDYLIIDGEKVETSAEFAKEYRKMQDAYRMKMRRNKECHCPKSKRLCCSTDCLTCDFHKPNIEYLDAMVDDDGNSYAGEYLYNHAEINHRTPEDEVVDADEENRIMAQIQELAPDLTEYYNLKLNDYADSKIAEILEIKRTTLISRRNKVYNMYKERNSLI